MDSNSLSIPLLPVLCYLCEGAVTELRELTIPRIRVTKSAIDGLPALSKDTVYWDIGLPGFGVKVTPKAARCFWSCIAWPARALGYASIRSVRMAALRCRWRVRRPRRYLPRGSTVASAGTVSAWCDSTCIVDPPSWTLRSTGRYGRPAAPACAVEGGSCGAGFLSGPAE